LVQIGDIALPFAPFPGTIPVPEPATVFSWIHNNIWDTNFPPGQAFEMTFRYRVGAFAADTVQAATTGAAGLADDVIRPLLGVTALPAGAPSAQFGLVQVSDARIRLLGLVSTGDGAIQANLQSLAEEPLDITLTFGMPIVRARTTTLHGDPRGDVPVDHASVALHIPALGVLAVQVEPDDTAVARFITPADSRS
jgi:hypothetical protein